ncbi:hypothetical protein [Microbacterium phyllosphaerae]|uniref:hypothetical protein n=1 Tax=Microbacterium phyllosphaerae TaxID=124798 RepID=UPI002168E2CC|nr:hypothetical protein [Microbacterium phyllosphaerae]MCS3442179.1 hypothetical protein [Microbacterium phyllosphaerae]
MMFVTVPVEEYMALANVTAKQLGLASGLEIEQTRRLAPERFLIDALARRRASHPVFATKVFDTYAVSLGLEAAAKG